jgi:hypothetical protein
MNIPDAIEHASDALTNITQAKQNFTEHHYIDALHYVENVYNDVNCIIHDLK